MQNRPIYRAAEALGIEDWEHETLAGMVGPLSRGELRLNMRMAGIGRWCNEREECGCLGAWMCFRGSRGRLMVGRSYGSDDFFVPLYSEALGPLFYPGRSGVPDGYDATGLQGAQAVVNFLTLGEPCWADVMGAA